MLPNSDSATVSPRKDKIAVVIPCYKVAKHLAGVVSRIGAEVADIYCVVDGCPDGSAVVAGDLQLRDSRIKILSFEKNFGVGHAFAAGCQQALADGANIVVKLDGDGQLAPEDISFLIAPLLQGEADYAKGNRFFFLDDLQSMPWIRLLGNVGLSFFSKLSSGYWNLFDPTNGFVAIHCQVAERIPWAKINRGYFFESDMLFQLSTLRAVVCDVPLPARYGDEQSNLSIAKAFIQFPFLHLLNFCKRIFFCYFLREFNVASLNLLLSVMLIGFGTGFGLFHWIHGFQLNQLASAGTVMFAALPVILGWQALLSFLAFDVGNVPKIPFRKKVNDSCRRAYTPGLSLARRVTRPERPERPG